ncbi:MAG: YiiX/YebB-like N1pC/P60 family cysteine hydrolase, partial [Planctomycetota bacterium]|nr:YiiX/YebB-like N1pC/P60 family cysteine hydrolase [Planctomycetota bacterium]
TLAEIGAYLDEKKKEWAEGAVLPTEDLAWLEGRIARSRAEVARLGAGVAEPKWKQIVARVKKDTYEPWYATQSLVSTWIGDTRLVRWEPLIRIEQIKQMEAKLQAGDILLERRNWFLSNAFLPGFWPHSALYVGRVEELEKLGLVKKVNGKWVGEGEMGKHLAEYLKKAADGEEHTVIEAISDGVVFNSLTESMHADYVAVLRPRVSEGQRAKAIAEAFGHVGKPYDFEFDFATADKLVCSEVVYRAYYGMIHLDEPWMQRIAGRWTLPPLEIARKFREERGKEGRELDFVMFLDGDVGRHEAKLAGEEVFCGTIERAKGFNE